MRKLIFLLFICYFIDVKGQNNFEWADSGAVWHLASNSFVGPGYQKMVYEKDTIINNHFCQKIHREAQILINTGGGVYTLSPLYNETPYFLYESNDSVFSYHNNQFFLAFKTNAFTGEIWDLGKLNETDTIQHAYVKVDSIYYETYNGLNLRNIKIHACDMNGDSINYNGPFPDTALTALIAPGNMGSIVNEKFGPMQSFNGINFAYPNFGIVEYMPAQVLCYKSSTFAPIQFSNTDCYNNVFAGIDEKDSNEFMLFPNPAQSIIYFRNKIPNLKISIFDIIGTHVLTQSLINGGISIEELTSGIYLYQIINLDEDIILTSKFIKN
ncbi:MAG TPA: T9SS type A sorting domain-containing protein [Bacteroidia bacterium]|nr:T9SS type A sorting domain-containing protein [Bacteroidia bacterium]